MAATPKPVRKLGKKIAESSRKDAPIVLKKAPKQMVKKHSKEANKMVSEVFKADVKRKGMKKASSDFKKNK